MTEHIILEAGLNPNAKVATEFDSSDGKITHNNQLYSRYHGDSHAFRCMV